MFEISTQLSNTGKRFFTSVFMIKVRMSIANEVNNVGEDYYRNAEHSRCFSFYYLT